MAYAQDFPQLTASPDASDAVARTAAQLVGWVRRAQDGDQAAFTLWVEHTYPMVFRCALALVGSRADAEDVCQEVFTRAWQKLPELHKPSSSVAWLLTLARRAGIDRLRLRARKDGIGKDDDVAVLAARALLATEAPADDVLARAEMRAALADALAAIDDDQRAVVLLRDVEGMSAPEIAALLDLPLGTVESRTHRGRLALRKALAQKMEGR